MHYNAFHWNTNSKSSERVSDSEGSIKPVTLLNKPNKKKENILKAFAVEDGPMHAIERSGRPANITEKKVSENKNQWISCFIQFIQLYPKSLLTFCVHAEDGSSSWR